jgi:hypothetical protein
MGAFAGAKRNVVNQTFEASSGDMKGDAEPVFIERRDTRKDVLTGEVRREGDTIEFRYAVQDPTLDDADVARIFHIAYLDVLTRHHWYNTTGPKVSRTHLRLVNSTTGATTRTPYPDPE